MDDPLKVTSVQHLYHIIASSETIREFFITTARPGRSWKAICFSDQLDKNGEHKLEIFNDISGTRQILTREGLEKKSLIGKAIRDGHFYLYDDNENVPKEEHLVPQSLVVSLFPKISKPWLLEHTDAVQHFMDAKSKDFEGIVFTAEDVLLHEEGLAHAIGELWGQEYSYYLPVDLVRYAECESVEPGKLTLKLWLAENHSVEEVQQYMASLNTQKLAQTITGLVLPRVDIQKYLFLTQEKLAEAIEHAREHTQSPKRKAKEEKDQMSFDFE